MFHRHHSVGSVLSLLRVKTVPIFLDLRRSQLGRRLLTPIKFGSSGRIRTYDLVVNSHPLYR